MPSFDKYKENNMFKNGEKRKDNANMIMEATWNNDPISQVAYLYDYYHDNYINTLRGLEPWKDSNKIPVDIKYARESSQTYAKDVVTYRMYLRPSQECNVPYYKEMYENIYNSIWPVGLFIDIKDAYGKYNKWMVVGLANFFDNQFTSFEILPVEKVLHYIYEGNKMRVPCVIRSQNSYNKKCCTI